MDFLYIVYSGHGYYKTCQHLGINKDNYTLTSECFKGWAPRQICVFDACAKIPKAESANEELIEDLKEYFLKYKNTYKTNIYNTLFQILYYYYHL